MKMSKHLDFIELHSSSFSSYFKSGQTFCVRVGCWRDLRRKLVGTSEEATGVWIVAFS